MPHVFQKKGIFGHSIFQQKKYAKIERDWNLTLPHLRSYLIVQKMTFAFIFFLSSLHGPAAHSVLIYKAPEF